MSRCLADRTLLLICDGESTEAYQAHLQTCTACATRYQQLIHDLKVIGQVLQEAPPSQASRSRSHVLRLRWMPMAAAVAVVLALVWGGMRVWWLSPPPFSLTASHEDVLQFMEEEVASALFSTTEARVAAMPAPVSDMTYLQAALEGEWPCERQEPFLSSGCDVHPFPLLMEGQ